MLLAYHFAGSRAKGGQGAASLTSGLTGHPGPLPLHLSVGKISLPARPSLIDSESMI